jgi:hypothetical protein
MQYAVYVVVIEDGSEADQALAERVESLERIAADLTYEQAEEIVTEAGHLYPFTGF